MWNRFSLRARLFLPLSAMFVAAMIIGAVLLGAFATGQLIEENEPAAHSARAVAAGLSSALSISPDPQRVLQSFAEGLRERSPLRFRRPGEPLVAGTASNPETQRVPAWFAALIGTPVIGASFPVQLGDEHVGDVVFAPDLSADMYEKWVGFLAIAVSTAVLMLLTAVIAFAGTHAAVVQLRELGAGLTRMRQGHYETRISERGPPEIRNSCSEANALAEALSELSRDNRALLRRLVTLQDDERRDLARELHDELGPLLFGVRANAVALTEAAEGRTEVEPAADQLMQAVEGVQLATRRVLERLRPLHIQELGLRASLDALLRDAHRQVPELSLISAFDPTIDDVDATVAQTVYRVVQESITNVLRHASARTVEVRVWREMELVRIEVSDDGVGPADNAPFGRGLTGMRERVRALGGQVELRRDGDHTRVCCSLPVGPRLT